MCKNKIQEYLVLVIHGPHLGNNSTGREHRICDPEEHCRFYPRATQTTSFTFDIGNRVYLSHIAELEIILDWWSVTCGEKDW